MTKFLTNLTGTVLDGIGPNGFCTLVRTYKRQERKSRLQSSVIGACGFSPSQLKEGVEVCFDAQLAGNGWQVVRVHSVGSMKASVAEDQLKAALGPLFAGVSKSNKPQQHTKVKRPARKQIQPKQPEVLLNAVGYLAKVNMAEGQVWMQISHYRSGEGVVEYDADDGLIEVGKKSLPEINFCTDEILDFDVVQIGKRVLATSIRVNVDCRAPSEVPDLRQQLLPFDDDNVVHIDSRRRAAGKG